MPLCWLTLFHKVVLFQSPRCFVHTGSSLASNPLGLLISVASKDEVLAINSKDAPITNLSKRPVLQPKETLPLQSTYTIKNQGKVCARSTLGVEFEVTENKVSLLFSQHFYLTSQHIVTRGENSLGLPPTLATAHCTVRKKGAKSVLGATALHWTVSFRVHLCTLNMHHLEVDKATS